MRTFLMNEASGRWWRGRQSLIAMVFMSLLLMAPASAQGLRCQATDGDTLRCGAERIRIIGLDAPEMRGKCPREARLARAARDRLAMLVARGVTIEPRGRDRYGRLLAVVRDREGWDVAQVLIAEGFARPYDGRSRRQGWC
ncbi:thermonuclease family protein [Sabulicella glaciei]|uniref:Thermonuclease family protein n=1 Tax=Sabulicella glaciei TaxID=2984948 RepID=A0ABT3P1D8_9PROT|nr:thermonuclease family protein [Roseococcus sp. MDT2-1-1]MCW8088211.1 thermonuclease family protein [Roseococcus sp. MDT2-1-1]